MHVHLAPVFPASTAGDEAFPGQTVHEFDRAMVLNLKALRQIGDAWSAVVGFPFDGKHQLVVLRFQPCFPGSFLAKAQETAKLVAELRQGLVVG